MKLKKNSEKPLSPTEHLKHDATDWLLRTSRGLQSIAMVMSVCLCVCLFFCLSVRSHNSKTARPKFINFCACCVWPWFGLFLTTAIRYVLPVLWMTYCFHTVATGALCVFLGGDRTREAQQRRFQPNFAQQ